MRIFTSTEIDLCKKIAEKERKELICGDFMILNFPLRGETVVLFDTEWQEEKDSVYSYSTDEQYKPYLPLWQEHDCLEFLRKQKSFRCYFIDHTNAKTVSVFMTYWKEHGKMIMKKGSTLLESLLRTVLTVLKEKS